MGYDYAFWAFRHQFSTVIISVCCHGNRFLISCFVTCCMCSLLPHWQPGAGWFFCRLIRLLQVFLGCIDFRCMLLVSLCCYSGVWCVALCCSVHCPLSLSAPASAAAAPLLSRPPVGNVVFDVKHLDGSHSALGLGFTAAHWPGQPPYQRNTAEAKASYLGLSDQVQPVAFLPEWHPLATAYNTAGAAIKYVWCDRCML